MNVWKKAWKNMMFPSTRKCMVCHHSITTYLPINELTESYYQYVKTMICSSCYHSIPWITSIQCRTCGRSTVCADCRFKKYEEYKGNRSAVQYNQQMKEWLKKYKFQGHQQLYELFGAMMLPLFRSVSWKLIQDLQLDKEWKQSKRSIEQFTMKRELWDAVISVPISQERLMERGFNQAEYLAKYMSQYYQLRYYELLQRSRDGKKLSYQGKWQRLESVQDMYTVNLGNWNRMLKEILGRRGATSCVEEAAIRILLVDDVYTTGNTIMSCTQAFSKVMVPQSVQIYSVTWARA